MPSSGDWKDMIYAIEKGDIDLVRYHVSNGVNINYQHAEFLTTPLIEAVNQNQLEIAKHLLDHGADPKLPAGFSNDTPLRIAKRNKNKAMVKLLRLYLPKKCFGWF